MKKWLIPIISMSLLVGCAEDALDTKNKEYVSEEQLQKLVENPESLLIYTNSVEDGTNSFLRAFDANGLGSHDDYGQKSIDLGLDLMAKDMSMSIFHWHGNYYRYTGRIQESRTTSQIWRFYYQIIRDANLILATIPSDVEDIALKNSRGRALALRGYAYFNLIRLYANGEIGIPLYTETENRPERVATSEVVNQVKVDLEEAYALLSGNAFTSASKTAIDQFAAAGLLARYYLEYGNYSQAAQMAQVARSNSAPDNESTLLDGFSHISNPTWIWGADITSETSSIYASYFSQIASLNPGYAGILGVYKNIDRELHSKLDSSDIRYSWFAPNNEGSVPAYANLKYYDDTFFEGDYLYMRHAEMQLIEAEAKALAGDQSGAQAVFSSFMSVRDAEYSPASNSKYGGLLEAIRFHRRIELWGEGFSFFDMKRWNMPLVRNYSGTNHPGFGRLDYPANSEKFIFQIPLDEINANDAISITDQNPL